MASNNPFQAAIDAKKGESGSNNPFAASVSDASGGDANGDDALAISYIEMMCSAPRVDNALARSILNSPSITSDTAEALKAGPIEDDDDDEDSVYENWSSRDAADGSGCLLSTQKGRSSTSGSASRPSGQRRRSQNTVSPNKAPMPLPEQKPLKKSQASPQEAEYVNVGRSNRAAPTKANDQASANNTRAEQSSKPSDTTPSSSVSPAKKSAPLTSLETYEAKERLREGLYACVHDSDNAEKRTGVHLVKYLDLEVDMKQIQSVDFMASKIFCKGFLVKLGAIRKNWKERWFVLDLERRSLAYYVDTSMTSLKGGMRLEDIHFAVLSQESTEKGKRSFSITCENRTFHLTARSVQIASAWVAAINSFAYYAHGRNPAVSSAMPSNGL